MNTSYNISTDVRFSPLELIDVKRIEREAKDYWVNQTLYRVNDCVVRRGVLPSSWHRSRASPCRAFCIARARPSGR